MLTDPTGLTVFDDVLSLSWITEPVSGLSGIGSSIMSALSGYGFVSDVQHLATAPTTQERGSASIEVSKDLLGQAVSVVTALAEASALEASAFSAYLTPGVFVSGSYVSMGYGLAQDTKGAISPLYNYPVGSPEWWDAAQQYTDRFNQGNVVRSARPQTNINSTSGKNATNNGAGNISTQKSIPTRTSLQVNVPVFVSTNPQTYSQTYTSTTRKYK
jgi:hypothetical protein